MNNRLIAVFAAAILGGAPLAGSGSDGDRDADGVMDTGDLCSGTAAQAPVNSDGCSAEQLERAARLGDVADHAAAAEDLDAPTDSTVTAEPGLAAGGTQCVRDEDEQVKAILGSSPAISMIEAGNVPARAPVVPLPVQVIFDPGGVGLAPSSAALLEQLAPRLAQMLANDPRASLEIAGYSSARGAATAQLHARMVRAYLLARGLPFARLRVVTATPSSPSEAGRVEIRAGA